MSREPWPWSKIDNFFKTKTPSPQYTPCVLFASGNLSPTHRGHVLMLHQAEDRLRRLGYEVLGGWLSPSHDLSVLADAKARGVPELRRDFRLHLAELSVAEDSSIAVAAYESQLDSIATDIQVARALYDTVNAKYADVYGKAKKIRVFCVCGCDHMAKYRLQGGFGSTDIGVVVVPREDTDEVLLEKPSLLKFVADACEDQAAALSSTKLRQAIIDGDRDYVKNAMNLPAARCVLQPTLKEQQAMKSDFEHLGVINPALDIIATESAWPYAKLQKRLDALEEMDIPAVLIVSGSMSPVHNGHFEVMQQGRERLERAGYKMLAGYLSPQNATGAAAEMRSTEGSQDEVALSSGFRLQSTKIAVCDDDFVALGAWEASVMGWVPSPHHVMDDLSAYLYKHIPALGERANELRIFYACDPGQAKRRGLSGAIGRKDRGLVIVPRADEDCFLLEKPTNLFFVAEPTLGEATIKVSRKIRLAIQQSDNAYVASNVPPSVARFVLSPTSTEIAEMQADFAHLRPTDPQKSSRLADPAVVKEAKAKFKSVLQAWAGPGGSISIDDIAKLLQVLDPSWTNSEIISFSSGAFASVSKAGLINCDDLVEWMFKIA